MKSHQEKEITMIPVSSVRVANPRVRDRRKFDVIVQSISEQGLKRPITVTEAKPDDEGRPTYDLVCGQGRLEAFVALGQQEIPALVRRMSKTDGLMASLVENLARRRVRSLDQIRLIEWMRDQGNSLKEISVKTGLAERYLQGILKLLAHGEERVLDAVLHGSLPITIGMRIAEVDDEGAQILLQEAYERGEMKQQSLPAFRRLLQRRKCFGKDFSNDSKFRGQRKATTDGLILAYKKETQRQRIMVKKAHACEKRLLTLTAVFKLLYVDEHFITLLRAEHLESLPKFLLQRVEQSK